MPEEAVGGPVAIFDLDGTLVDSMPIVRELMSQAIERFSGSPRGAGALDSLMGPPEEEILERVAGAGAARWYRARYIRVLAGHADRLRSREFGVPLLDVARSCGFATAVLTNKSEFLAAATIDAADLGAGVDFVLSGSEGIRPKPAGDGVEHVLAELRGDPARSIMLGDSAHDRSAARSGGVEFSHARWFGHGHWCGTDHRDVDGVSEFACDLARVATSRGVGEGAAC